MVSIQFWGIDVCTENREYSKQSLSQDRPGFNFPLSFNTMSVLKGQIKITVSVQGCLGFMIPHKLLISFI